MPYSSLKVDTKYPEVFIDINLDKLSYKIMQTLPSGKLKVRRHVVGRPATKLNKNGVRIKMVESYRNYGTVQLYNRFLDVEDAKNHALQYVENHLKLII